jgi:hypothetical protein
MSERLAWAPRQVVGAFLLLAVLWVAGAGLAAVNAVAGLTLLAVAAWLTLGMVGSALQGGGRG